MAMELELDPRAAAKTHPHRAKPLRKPVSSPSAVPTGLTAGDLIALLEDLDPATPVVIEGQYGGYASARGISRVPLRFNVNSLEGFGPHDHASQGKPAQALAVAVLVTPSADIVE